MRFRELGVWQNKHKCLRRKTWGQVCILSICHSGSLSVVEVGNHGRGFIDFGGNSVCCFVDDCGHPKTLQDFSTQGNGIGLMLPVSGVPIVPHEPSCIGFRITYVANMFRSYCLLPGSGWALHLYYLTFRTTLWGRFCSVHYKFSIEIRKLNGGHLISKWFYWGWNQDGLVWGPRP